MRCIPGYELPWILPKEGQFDTTLETQTITCLFDEVEGGKWSNIIACQPVRCKTLPPPTPSNGMITVIKSIDTFTNAQAETILTYTCSQPSWAFNYPYDENQAKSINLFIESLAFLASLAMGSLTAHKNNGLENLQQKIFF